MALIPLNRDSPPSSDKGEVPLEKTVQQHCEITIVDFSRDDVRVRRLDNEILESFLKEEKEPWATCRWINVNGISWDVVKLRSTCQSQKTSQACTRGLDAYGQPDEGGLVLRPSIRRSRDAEAD